MSGQSKDVSELSGTTIDKYNLIRLVGEGGMGVVYEARHTLVRKRCALKILHPALSKNQEVVQRMLREAQAAAEIGHPNIVETHDFGETADGTYYLVMEYLEGWSLGGMLQKHNQLDVDTAVAVTIQVLSALVAAHTKGIVHRDLKPDNIFIAKSRRGGEEVKLLDFGISKFTLEGTGNLNLTRTGAILGTPNYMSPEQASGRDEVDRRSDLWAVGVILYQVLTGELPFTGKNYNELMFNIVQEEPVAPREHRPDLPEKLQGLILKALEKNKDLRFQTAAEMVAALLPFYDRDKAELERFVLRKTVPPRDPKRTADTVVEVPGEPSMPTVKTPDGTLAGPAALQARDASEPGVATQAYDGPLFLSPGPGGASTGPGPQPEPDGPDVTPAPDRTEPVAAGSPITPSQIAGRKSVIFGRRFSRKTGLLAAGGVLTALVTGVVVGVLIMGKKDKKPARPSDGEKPPAAVPGKETPAPVDAGPTDPMVVRPSRPMEPRARKPTTSPRKARKRRISVKLKGLPRGAKVKLDGKTVRSPLKMTADNKRHTLEIRAQGFKPLTRTFTARVRTRSIQVRMTRIRRGRPRRPRGPRVTRDGIYKDPYGVK
jgi:serine/threonine-protein kinase